MGGGRLVSCEKIDTEILHHEWTPIRGRVVSREMDILIRPQELKPIGGGGGIVIS